MEFDTGKPNGGRIYDYLLGGSHYFEVDRIAAEQMLTLAPSARPAAKLNRWFMLTAVSELVRAGYTHFLDLATGLPTQDYVHELAPNARVLYNDIDPLTVAYAREIIGDNEQVRYIQANITDLDSILAAADTHFHGERHIAICFIGSTYFVDEEHISSIIDRLYDWAAPGSAMAMSWLVANPADANDHPVIQLYRSMNSPVTLRTVERIEQLLKRWKVRDPGLRPLSEWLDIDSDWHIANGLNEIPFDMYGVIVHKP